MKLCLSAILLAFICLVGCTPQFEPIDYGHDSCQHCKMTIMDKRFACEILTKKGKAFKFDDIKCLTAYAKETPIPESHIAKVYVANYGNPESNFIDAYTASFLRGDAFKSPMNGNVAAFPSADAANKAKGTQQAELLTWKDVQ